MKTFIPVTTSFISSKLVSMRNNTSCGSSSRRTPCSGISSILYFFLFGSTCPPTADVNSTTKVFFALFVLRRFLFSLAPSFACFIFFSPSRENNFWIWMEEDGAGSTELTNENGESVGENEATTQEPAVSERRKSLLGKLPRINGLEEVLAASVGTFPEDVISVAKILKSGGVKDCEPAVVRSNCLLLLLFLISPPGSCLFFPFLFVRLL